MGKAENEASEWVCKLAASHETARESLTMRLTVRSGSCIIVLYSVLWRSHYGGAG